MLDFHTFCTLLFLHTCMLLLQRPVIDDTRGCLWLDYRTRCDGSLECFRPNCWMSVFFEKYRPLM